MIRRTETEVGSPEEEIAWESVKTFHRHAKPVLDEFRRRDRLAEIDCSGGIGVGGVDDEDSVFDKIVAALKAKMLSAVTVLFVVGGPGCGKGTQCDRLKAAFALKHISSGDLLREEVDSGSETGRKLKAIMLRGELVPMKTVLFMIQTKMMEAVIRGFKGFLIDGYPREREQVNVSASLWGHEKREDEDEKTLTVN